MFADTELAARLEALAADSLRGLAATAATVDPDVGVASLDVAGGVAVYLGDDSPVNQAIGIGFAGGVSSEQAAELEDFFGQRGQQPLAVVSPLAHLSVLNRLAARGWVADGFENVLVREIIGNECIDESRGVEVRLCEDEDEKALWAQIAAIAFSSPLEPQPQQFALSRVAASRPGARLLLAYVDGRPAACGELSVAGGVGWLSADGTLPHFRRRGAQQALQAARLAISAEEGCDLAVTESIPGSLSQRNMERAGFRVAYTRVDLILPKRKGS
ncbi:MAG TPA: hypothetical protein VFG89_10805 [Coriobacteriia bacterium]|nr:hypothetical protein [Coriobacteriia bacterium]